MRFKGELKFFTEDFWDLMKKQDGRCFLTGRKLEPTNCEVELKNPKLREDRFNLKNFYLVDKDVSYLARHLSEEEIWKLAEEIFKWKG